jgi:hypothetical protein
MGGNIAMDLTDIKYNFVQWIELGIQWHAFVNIVMTCQVKRNLKVFDQFLYQFFIKDSGSWSWLM